MSKNWKIGILECLKVEKMDFRVSRNWKIGILKGLKTESKVKTLEEQLTD